MTSTTVGREPIQIVELLQPFCVNTFGSAPCTASGAADVKCYNTRATCLDTANFRIKPEGSLGNATFTKTLGETVTSAEIDVTADFFAAFDVTFPATIADGILWEQGSSTQGFYLGVSGGNLVARIAGSGTAANERATISTSATPWAGDTVTLYVSADVSAGTLSLWSYVSGTRTLTAVGTDTASAGFLSGDWADSGDGAVGKLNGTTLAGYDTSDWGSTLTEARFWSATAAPDMTMDDFYLHLYFSRGNVADRSISGYVIPSLRSVSTAPTTLNLAAANPDASALGTRATCTVTFTDHQHTDRIVDPYLAGRSWDPLSSSRGSFWTRWMARNKYRQGMRIKIYEGYDGQALASMRVREYFLTEVTGPNASGIVTIKGKDILTLIEERKAQAPLSSNGKLRTAINETVTMLDVTNALIEEYPDSGTIRIGSELMTYTAVAETADYLTFSGIVRGTDNTTAETHEVDDEVQTCLRYMEADLEDVLIDLLVNYGKIPKDRLDFSAWQTEFEDFLPFYKVNSILSEPVSVSTLIAELQEQCLFLIWWCECNQSVKLRSFRGPSSEPVTLYDSTHILADSLTVEELPRERASQVWFHYNPIEWDGSFSDGNNFHSGYVLADLESETEELYGSASVRKIYSRWLSNEATIGYTLSRILAKYVDVPRQIKFQMDAKDRETYWTGAIFKLNHYLLVDVFGERKEDTWIVTSAEEIAPGEIVEYVAQNITNFLAFNYIMPSGSSDYNPGGSNPVKNCFIGDADGLLSDGEICGRIG